METANCTSEQGSLLLSEEGPVMHSAPKNVKINTCNARHELALLRELISRNIWKEQHLKDKVKDQDIYWLAGTDFAHHLELIKEHDVIFNRLPGVEAGSNKKIFSQIFQQLQRTHPDEFDFIPRTFVMPKEAKEASEYMEAHPRKTFICKPQEGSEGCGIVLAKKFKDIPKFAMEQDYIVQEYLSSPLLLNRKKFDLRVYILVLSLGSAGENPSPVVCWLADEGLARFCTEDY